MLYKTLLNLMVLTEYKNKILLDSISHTTYTSHTTLLDLIACTLRIVYKTLLNLIIRITCVIILGLVVYVVHTAYTLHITPLDLIAYTLYTIILDTTVYIQHT